MRDPFIAPRRRRLTSEYLAIRAGHVILGGVPRQIKANRFGGDHFGEPDVLKTPCVDPLLYIRPAKLTGLHPGNFMQFQEKYVALTFEFPLIQKFCFNFEEFLPKDVERADVIKSGILPEFGEI